MLPADDPRTDGRRRGREPEAAYPFARGSVVLGRLREAIIDGTLAPGAKLSEPQLAKEHDVSRTPVREALAKLQQEGLVDVYPHVGSFVRGITVEDVRDLYQIRIALETLALRLCRGRLTAVAKAELASIVDEMKVAVRENDPKRYAVLLDDFHLGLMRFSGNRMLRSMYQSLMGPVRRLRRLTLRRAGRLKESLDQHVAIAEALLAGDPTCEQHMTDHLTDAARVLTAVLAPPGASAVTAPVLPAGAVDDAGEGPR